MKPQNTQHSEPYGWVSESNEFTQEQDVLAYWQDEEIEYVPVWDRPNTGVECPSNEEDTVPSNLELSAMANALYELVGSGKMRGDVRDTVMQAVLRLRNSGDTE